MMDRRPLASAAPAPVDAPAPSAGSSLRSLRERLTRQNV